MTRTDATNPATLPAGNPAEDPRPIYRKAARLVADLIEAVTPEQLHAPTELDWDVRGLLEHLVMVQRRVAAAGRNEPPTTWPIDAADVSDDGFAAAWQASLRDVEEAWRDDAALDRPTELPWGTFPGREVLGVYTNEIVVHAWDLTRATAQVVEWPDDVVALADTAIRAQLPMADRAPMWAEVKASLPPEVEWEDPFGPAVEVPDDAPAIDRLVAWNGRQPSPNAPM